MNKLVGRSREMNILLEEYQKEKSSMMVIMGRDGIGKKRLIREFIKENNINPLFFSSVGENDKANRDLFKQAMLEYTGLPCLSETDLEWDVILKCFLGSKDYQKRVIVINGLDNLLKANTQFLVELQSTWEGFIKERNVLFILMGELSLSSKYLISDMFDKILTLNPLPFECYQEFYPEKTHGELLEIFSYTGGIPLYMELFENRSIEETIKETVLNRNNIFFDKPINYLNSRLRHTISTHLTVLRLVSMNYLTPGEIKEISKKGPQEVIKAVEELIDLNVLTKENPAYDLSMIKSKFVIYRFTNPFFKLWFKLNYNHRLLLDLHEEEKIYPYYKEGYLNDMIESGYNMICYQILEKMRLNKELSFDSIGKLYDDELQIDIVAINKKTKEIIIGDTSLTDHVKNLEDLEDLVKFKKSVVQRKFKDYTINTFIMFSETGFTEETQKKARKYLKTILVDTRKFGERSEIGV